MCRSCLSEVLFFGHRVVPDPLWPHGPQHARLPCASPSRGVCSDSHPLSRWCHRTVSSSVVASPSAFSLSLPWGPFHESALRIGRPILALQRQSFRRTFKGLQLSDSVVSNSSWPRGGASRLLCPWTLQARVLEWAAISFSNSKV